MEKTNTFIKTIIVLMLICVVGRLEAQVIQGKVSTEDGVPLNKAIVNILHQKDSIFHSFARTDEAGHFSISTPADSGEYLLVFMHAKHTDVSLPLHIGNQFQTRDLGEIKLPLNSVFLEEVVITAKRLMRMKGDTIEYDISGLTLTPNSRVEDVLDQLPGMQVTRGGQIYSHGKIIERVLVDGEPFFGNDPTLVTRNIRSDMVDKIQVYDDASENEKITGIKDNNKRKTIDIKLKEDKKKGMFGVAQVGYLNEYYNNMIMLNKFSGKEKIFGYGVMSNTGKLGVGYKNLAANGGSLGGEFDGSTGKFTGEGAPKVYSGGLSYSNDWEKHKLNTNVSVNGVSVRGDRSVYQIIDSDNRPRENTSTTDFKRTTQNQNFELNYEREAQTRFYVSLDAGHERSFDVYQRDSRLQYAEGSELINTLKQNNDSEEDVFRTDLNVNWSTGFKKEGRRISIGFQPRIMSATSDSYIAIDNNDDTLPAASELKVNGGRHEHHFDFRLSYSEPILKGELVSSFENKTYLSGKRSDVISEEAQYVGRFGGDFHYTYGVNRLKSVYRTTAGKFSTEFGAALSLEKSNLENKSTIHTVRNHFVFFQPTAELEYKWSQTHWIKAQYGRTNIAPTAFLVQPFGDAEDLVNVYRGNMELRPRSIQRFYVSYHSFKLMKINARNAWFEYNLKQNDIGYAIEIGEEQNIITPININKRTYDYTFSTSYGKEVTDKKDYLWLQLDGKQSMGYNYVNGTENRLLSSSLQLRPNFSFRPRGGFSFNLGAGPVFERLDYSQNDDLNFQGLGFQGRGATYMDFPLGFRLEQQFNYAYKPQNKLLGTSMNQLLWDITLLKRFGKENMFTTEFSVNDLLNQNLGLQRIYGNTGFTERRYSTINRYFLLTFKWDLNRMGN